MADYIKIYNDEELFYAEYCERKADGVCGWYDFVNDKFYEDEPTETLDIDYDLPRGENGEIVWCKEPVQSTIYKPRISKKLNERVNEILKGVNDETSNQ